MTAARASSWVDGIDQFPLGGSVGFLMDTERRTSRGAAAYSHVKLATSPLELANHCNSQPMLHHLTTFDIIRQTAHQTTHTHTAPLQITSTTCHTPLPPDSLRLAKSHMFSKNGKTYCGKKQTTKIHCSV